MTTNIKPAKSTPLARLQEATTVVEQATLILKLQERFARVLQIQVYLETLLTPEHDKLVRFACADRLALALQNQSPPKVVSTLLELLQDAKPLAPIYNTLPIERNDIVSDISMCLSLAGEDQAERIIPYLIQALNQYSSLSAVHVSLVLLSLTFPAKPTQPVLPMKELTPLQQQVIHALLASRQPWKWGNTRDILEHFRIASRCQRFCTAHAGPVQSMMLARELAPLVS